VYRPGNCTVIRDAPSTEDSETNFDFVFREELAADAVLSKDVAVCSTLTMKHENINSWNTCGLPTTLHNNYHQYATHLLPDSSLTMSLSRHLP